VTSFLVFLAILAAIVFWGIGIYNRLVNERNRVKNAFAQIDVQLTRRYDLIPNLVEAVKGYMKHERETLEAVINARNAASSSLDAAKADPANAQAIKELGASEGALTSALGRLFALSEAYPDLKANQQAFNDSVLQYNNSAQNFPNNVIAGFFSFELASFLEIESEEMRQAPEVSFT
jgi:LemA protein